MTMPIASAIASETGKASQAGSSAKPPPAPPVPKISATIIAASAITDSIDRSMCPAISVSDRPTAMMPTKVDCSRMLRKMPIWRKFGIVEREGRQHDDEDEPDQIVEDELDRAAPRDDGEDRRESAALSCGHRPLPRANVARCPASVAHREVLAAKRRASNDAQP